MKIKFRAILAPLIFASSLSLNLSVQAQQYWDTDGVGAAINAANWSSSISGPFTSAFTSNADIVFSANSSVTGATVDIGNITVNNNVIVNFTAGGTLGTGGNVRTINVGSGGVLNLSGQALSVAAGAGWIKEGAGILQTSNGNTYTGGFTLNEGIVVVGGVNALGAGGVLTINGGIIAAGAARDLSGKYTSIVIGGDFGIGASTTALPTGNATVRSMLTFNNTMNFGDTARSISGEGLAILGGVISGTAGFTKAGSSTIVLTNTGNTYSGPTQVNSGTLSFRTASAASTSSTYTYGAGATLGLGVGTGRFTDAEVVAAFAGTVPASLATVSIASGTNISIDTIAAAHVFGGTIAPTTRGLEKIIGGANLTLSSTSNQYSGRTVVHGGGALLVSTLGNIGDASSNIGTNSTIDLMKEGRIDISSASSSNKNFNIQGTATEPSVIFPGSGLVTLSGSISTETAGLKEVRFGTNAAVSVPHEVSGIISNGSGTMNVRKINSGRIILSGANTFTGTTTNAAGILELTNALALQNSTLDTALSAAGTSTVGIRTTTTTMTLGGLSGNKNFAAASGVFTTTSGGYDAVTALTLNPGASASPSYAGVIANGASNMTLTKTGAGTQTLTGVNTYTGATSINAGTLALGASGTILTSPSISIAPGATLATTLKTSYSIPTGQPVTFGIDAAGSGSSGRISATGLNITDATVTYNFTGTPDDPVYVLATYSSLTGTAFASAPTPPAGYTLDYAYEGNKIALVSASSPYGLWSGGANSNLDTNNDGILNGVAWVLGAANPNTVVTSQVPTFDNVNDPDFLIFNFRRSDAALSDSQTAIKVQYGSDLIGWADAVASNDIIITPTDDFYGLGIDKVEVKIRRSLAIGSKLFARLHVVITP